jgi:DNA-directed RNA polymerase specialized sigma24 family protein
VGYAVELRRPRPVDAAGGSQSVDVVAPSPATRFRGLSRLGARADHNNELDPRDSELWRIVRALPTRQAQMIALVYVEQLTLPEAAVALHIALPAAKTHLARAKQRLATDLADWKTQCP